MPKPLVKSLESHRAELVERIGASLTRDGSHEPQRGVFFYRSSSPGGPTHGVLEPSLCVIAQGSKDVLLGEKRFHYNPAHYLISTVGVPVAGQIVRATPAEPYLSFRLVLDPAIVTAVITECGADGRRGESSETAVDVSQLEMNLFDAVLRLVRLTDSAHDYRVLGPLVTREIIYRLLMGAQGNRLRHLAAFGGHSNRMVRAVDKLKQQFDKPMSVEDLARETGMSVSSFHSHFKAVTSMSPLQFQKQLRLQEARRLMLAEDLDAGEAGYRVGYDDPSHFSREYKRHFGESPMRDVERLRVIA
jgi:AraC-like DNA-binding protein